MEKIKETWVFSDPEKCKCGISDLYDLIADSICGKAFDHYDVTKVYVGKEVLDRVEEYYLEQGADRADFGMLWVCYGPKATLEGYEVQVDAGWAYDDESEV